MTRLALLPMTFVIVASQLTSATEPLVLRRNEVVAFLGGTSIVDLQNAGYLESMMTAASPDAKPKFIDMGWAGDTVFAQGTTIERWREDKFGDLSRQLDDHAATLVIAQFGQIESLAGLTKLDDFIKAYEQLLVTFKENNRRVVILSPTPFGRPNEFLPDPSQRNIDLGKYVTAIEQLATMHDCRFVDLFSYWDYSVNEFTSNGLHVTSDMQFPLAVTIGNQLRIPTGDAKSLAPLRTEVIKKHQLWMNYWRPANWKCLYGDDGEREFGKATGGSLTLREEWKLLPGLIAESEERIWRIAADLKGSER